MKTTRKWVVRGSKIARRNEQTNEEDWAESL